MGRIEVTPHEAGVVDAARREFDKYAAFDGENFEDFTRLRELQIRLTRWENRNFGVQVPSVFAHGIAEEGCWELLEAEDNQNQDEIFDAFGDIYVYACNGATLFRLDFETLVENFNPVMTTTAGRDPTREMVKAIGAFNHVVLKHNQKIRGYDDPEQTRRHAGAMLHRLLKHARILTLNYDWDAAMLFNEVATAVLKRDFTKNRITGSAS